MRLRAKLSLLLLSVVVIGSAATAILVRNNTETLFRTFLFEDDSAKAEAYASLLAGYRREKGGFAGIQEFLLGLPGSLSESIEARIHSGEDRYAMAGYPATELRPLFADRVAVADTMGFVIADTSGELLGTQHPSRHLEHGVSILADGAKVGTVLVGSMVDSSLTGVNERYLDSITLSLVASSAISAFLALAIGLAFAARISSPLQVLAAAARKVAGGELSVSVPVRGKDEVAGVASAFNGMTSELKRLDAAKKRVIADVSHELRTPVTLIQGTLEGMVDGVFPVDMRTLESVHGETVRLAMLIDTLRELEIIESGELELSIEGVDLDELAVKALTLFSPEAGAKGIRLSSQAGGPDAPKARGDYLRLGQVLHNLLSNAIKYTPRGGQVRLLRLDDRGRHLAFAVEDSGPGIPVDERRNVFERFYRLDETRGAGTGGRGLGLAIAAEIVKAHGGSIGIESSSLGGARFVVTLPRFDG